jgi:sugar/nucleoside kinase (ribokinase family)
VGGYLLMPGLLAADLGDVLSRIHRRGTRVVLDVAIPHDSTPGMESVVPLLPHVDCFLPNRDEAEALTGLADPPEQAAAFLEAGCSSVVITSGADGATYVDSTQMIEVSPLPVDFVDGSGSGDAFTAGLILGMARGWPVDESLRLAAAMGASVCRGLGCSRTLFTFTEAIEQMPRVRIHHTAR